MKRQFRVDASQKIQAAPVDFDRFDGMTRGKPQKLKEVLESHQAELESYLDAKLSPIVEQLNNDFNKILSTYVDCNDVAECNAFLDALCGVNTGTYDVAEESNVLDNLTYKVESDSAYIFTLINYDETYIDREEHEDDMFYGPNTACVVFLDFDPATDNINQMLHITMCNTDGFVEALSMALCCQPYIQQVTVDNVVYIAEQIIYEFSEFVDTQFSRILGEATETFLQG